MKLLDRNRGRETKFELLRMIAMLMIVFHHFALYGGFDFANTISLNHFWYNLIISGGKIGVILFVFISGYFLIDDPNPYISLKKVIHFWMPVIFYSVAGYLIFLLAGRVTFNVKSFISFLFPITFSQWWFASAYFVLYLIHPFLNKMLLRLSKTEFQYALILMVVLWSIIPTLTTKEFQSNSLVWFVVLYSIAAYIKIYGLRPNWSCRHYFLAWLILSLLTYLTSVLFMLLGKKWMFFAEHEVYFYGLQKFSTLLIALSLFMGFVTLDVKQCKFVNLISSATFGVYLIHEHALVRNWLWITLCHAYDFQNSGWLILFSIAIVICVFISCVVIDLFRQYVLHIPFMKLFDKTISKLQGLLTKFIDFLRRTIFGSSTNE